MIRKGLILVFGFFVALVWTLLPLAFADAQSGSLETSDFGNGNGSLRCSSSAQEFEDWSAASVTQGNTTLYVGYAQVSGNNQNPIMASWTNGTQDWCRDDIETNGDDGNGIGLWWDGGSTAYGVFTATGTQGDSSQDYRRFTQNGWLRHYTDASPGGGGGPKVSIILRVDAATGVPDAGTFITARLSNNKTNSTKAVDLDVAGNGNVVVRMESAFHARNTDKSRMNCSSYPIDHFLEFTADLSTAVGSISTNCAGNSPVPPNAPVPQEIKRLSPADDAVNQPTSLTLSWEEDAYSEWYHVNLIGSGGWSFDQWYDGAQVCSSGTCSTANITIPAGEVSWWMSSWGADTTGANIDGHPGFMGAYTESTFRVGGNPPGEINRVAPLGRIADPIIPFTWDHDNLAEWYQVYVVNPNGPDFNQWFAATGTGGVCSGSTCTIDPADTGWWLSNGQHDWYMQAWGNGDLGPWNSTPAAFAVDADNPGTPTITVPANPPAGTVTISWDELPELAWYNVWVGSTSATAHYEWHEARDVCDMGTCSIDVSVTAGTYTVWMQAWGPGGMSPWTDSDPFTAN